MKIFIWDDVADLTINYHSGGGVAVIAPSLERARELLPSPRDHDAKVETFKRCEAHDKEPTAVYEIQADAERVFVFPDAGCC